MLEKADFMVKNVKKVQIRQKLQVALVAGLVVFIGLLFVAQPSVASSVAASGGAQVIEGETTGLSARLEMRGNKYTQDIVLDVPNAGGVERSRQLILDGSIMRRVSDWVKDSSYGDMGGADSPYSFKLAIGKLWVVFTHRFKCMDAVLTSKSWQQICEQAGMDRGDKIVVENGLTDISCVAGKGSMTRCSFKIDGRASNFKAMGSEVEGTEVVGILFREYVNYISHLGLILNNDAHTVAEAQTRFKGSSYESLVQGIDERINQRISQLSGRKMGTNETFVLEAALESTQQRHVFNSLDYERVLVSHGR